MNERKYAILLIQAWGWTKASSIVEAEVTNRTGNHDGFWTRVLAALKDPNILNENKNHG